MCLCDLVFLFWVIIMASLVCVRTLSSSIDPQRLSEGEWTGTSMTRGRATWSQPRAQELTWPSWRRSTSTPCAARTTPAILLSLTPATNSVCIPPGRFSTLISSLSLSISLYLSQYLSLSLSISLYLSISILSFFVFLVLVSICLPLLCLKFEIV